MAWTQVLPEGLLEMTCRQRCGHWQTDVEQQVSVSFNVKALPHSCAESLARLTHLILPATRRHR